MVKLLKNVLLFLSITGFLITYKSLKLEASSYPEGVFFYSEGDGAHMVLDGSFLMFDATRDLSNPERHKYTWKEGDNVVTIFWNPLSPNILWVFSHDKNGSLMYSGMMGTVDLIPVSWACHQFKTLGLGNFPVGHPNYKAARDPNTDGIACEM